MLFQDDRQLLLVGAIIALGAKQATAKELQVVLAAGQAAKPANYDADIKGLSQRYRGDQFDIVQRKIRERYPRAGPMPVSPINWLAFFARSDAGVYVVDAERFLEKVAATERKAEAFKRACEDIGMLQLMPELERRVLTGVKAMVVHLGWQKVSDDDVGVPVGHMYWPSDVVVICHPSAPADDRAITVLGLRQTPTSAAQDCDTWWIWSRTCVENDDGSVKSWGRWQHVRITTDGKHTSLPVEYPGELLPVAILRIEQADGGFWPAPERDTITQVDELNLSRSNEQHTVDLQGHGQGVYSGTENEAADLPIGPDRWVRIGPSETLTTVDFNPKLEAMLASRQQSQREIAASRSNNPDAYATTPTVAISGVSRAIANLPHDRRIRELRPIFKRFEETRLLPILIEVLNLFAPDSYAPRMGVVQPRVVFGVAPDFEELDQKQRRLEMDLKIGVISQARYAVLMGHYDNIRAAVDAGLSDKLTPTATPTPSTAGAPTTPVVDPPKPEPAKPADPAEPIDEA
jgi:hypothetical protein